MRRILLLFLASGATGLVYQVVWVRILGLVFGHTTQATATVVGAYMAGLGLGALVIGRLADSSQDPIRLYARLEIGIAGWAFTTPLLWRFVNWITPLYASLVAPSEIHSRLFELILGFLLLLPVTMMMGGTLPALSRHVVRKKDELAWGVGSLYAWNTFGAVVGVLATAFFALEKIGVWQTAVLAGVLNLVVGALAWRLGSTSPPEAPSTAEESPQVLLLALFATSGAVALACEMAWTRALVLVIGSSIQALATTLITFLAGLALGSLILSWWSRRSPIDRGTLVGVQAAMSIAIASTLPLVDQLPWWFTRVYAAADGQILLVELGRFLLSGLVILAPTVAMGASFTVFIHLVGQQRIGRGVGVAYLANSLGSVVGAVATGFVLVPLIGIRGTLVAASFLSLAIGATALARRPTTQRKVIYGSCVLVVTILTWTARWDSAVLTSGLVVKLHEWAGRERRDLDRYLREKQPLYYQEGREFTVDVSRYRDTVALAINGKVDASTDRDLFTQYFIGHLPLLLYPTAQDVLVVGLASGSTVAAVAEHPVAAIDCVELEPAMIPASEHFVDVNRGVLADPRVRVVVDDVRGHLVAASSRWDVIVSQPSNPWIAGVANLFSKEYFELLADRIEPEGVVCIWLQAYNLSSEDLRMVVATFARVFPAVAMWTSTYPDLVLTGRLRPTPIDMESLASAFDSGRADLEPWGLDSPETLLAHHLLDDRAVREMAAGARINTDNHPILEFTAPRSLYQDTFVTNLTMLREFESDRIPETIGASPARLLAGIARGRLGQGRVEEARAASAEAMEMDPADSYVRFSRARALSAAGDPDAALLLLSEASRRAPLDPAVADHLGRNLAALGFQDQAIDSLRRAVEIDPARRPAWLQLAAVTGDPSSRIEALERALALKPEYDLQRQLIAASFQLRDPVQLERLVTRITARYPVSPEVHEDLAQGFEQIGDLESAAAVLQSMTRKFPDEDAVRINLSRVRGRLKSGL